MSIVSRAGLDPFYPIVPDIAWLKRLVPLGLRVVQLRLKDADSAEVREQIDEALEITRAHGCQLIINDYWREAIDAGADYIHLGQEDLAAADMGKIKKSGLRLGVSTHDKAELETALAVAPDYIALGPVYETKLKVMKWRPQGLERVSKWRTRIGDLPLVAIGGLTTERAPGVLEAGASSIAVITDLVTAVDPEAQVSHWLSWADGVRLTANLASD